MAKIMFNDEVNLTQLVLERIKNMTRRTIPQKTLDFVFNDFRHAYYEATLDWLDEKETLEQCFFVDKMKKLPYQIGDVVAIAQSYKDCGYDGDTKYGWCYDENEERTDVLYKDVPGWKNKMFVRSSRMPHAIRITDIKIERLKDISDEDCLREGIIPKKLDYTPAGYPKGLTYYGFYGWGVVSDHAKDAFAALIDKVSGRGTWDKNPWVFAYSFELVK